LRQQLLEGQTSDESAVFALQSEFFVPEELPGSDCYGPSFEIVGTAYVHDFMNGEVERDYENGRATMQTYLLV